MEIIKSAIRKFLEIDFDGFDEVVDNLKGAIHKAEATCLYLEKENLYLVDRILNNNSMIQLQAMFIESKKLRKEFNAFTEKHGYKFKKANKSKKDAPLMTT